MGERPNLGTPFGVDGPWYAAILDVLHDVHDMLDARLPQIEPAAGQAGEPVSGGQRRAVPVSEPAPNLPPDGAAPVTEPDPDDEPDLPDEAAPAPRVPEPPRAGRGSGADVWKAFADDHHVSCDPDASRNDIVAACITAGVIAAPER